MPILREEVKKVEEYIDSIPKELTPGEISDVWLVIFLGIVLYFGSGIVSLLLKVGGLIVVILGLITVAEEYGIH